MLTSRPPRLSCAKLFRRGQQDATQNLQVVELYPLETAACAPDPPGPYTTVGISAAASSAASIQPAEPVYPGSRPEASAALSRTKPTIGSSVATSKGSRTNVVLTSAAKSGSSAARRSKISRTAPSAPCALSPGTVRRSISSKQRSG